MKLVAANLRANGCRVGSGSEEEEGEEGEHARPHGSHGHGHGKEKHVSGKKEEKEEMVEGKGPRVGVEELDWFGFLPSSSSNGPSSTSTSASNSPAPPLYDLVVSSDCIYNPHLLRSSPSSSSPSSLSLFAHVLSLSLSPSPLLPSFLPTTTTTSSSPPPSNPLPLLHSQPHRRSHRSRTPKRGRDKRVFGALVGGG